MGCGLGDEIYILHRSMDKTVGLSFMSTITCIMSLLMTKYGPCHFSGGSVTEY